MGSICFILLAQFFYDGVKLAKNSGHKTWNPFPLFSILIFLLVLQGGTDKAETYGKGRQGSEILIFEDFVFLHVLQFF